MTPATPEVLDALATQLDAHLELVICHLDVLPASTSAKTSTATASLMGQADAYRVALALVAEARQARP